MNSLKVTTITAVAAMFLVGCSPPPDDEEETGHGDAGNHTADTGENGGSGGDNGDGAEDVDWTGTWTADLDYSVTCESIGNEKSGEHQHTEAFDLTGDNSSLTLELDNYRMNGTGDNESLTLSGDFPVRDFDGDPAGIDGTQSPNNITFELTNIASQDEASGEVTGSFENSTGWECTIDDGGSVTFTR